MKSAGSARRLDGNAMAMERVRSWCMQRRIAEVNEIAVVLQTIAEGDCSTVGPDEIGRSFCRVLHGGHWIVPPSSREGQEGLLNATTTRLQRFIYGMES